MIRRHKQAVNLAMKDSVTSVLASLNRTPQCCANSRLVVAKSSRRVQRFMVCMSVVHLDLLEDTWKWKRLKQLTMAGMEQRTPPRRHKAEPVVPGRECDPPVCAYRLHEGGSRTHC
uniref:Uncharacterized protein n=1 Tax=Ascaris lumbricoides TaxID=6252 RepID=A0A0M3HML9_ASCLU